MEAYEDIQTIEDMIKIKYKNWNEVPIKVYREISEICQRDIEPLDKNIALISLLSDTPEETCWDLELPEAERLFKDIQWLWSFKFKKNWRGKKIKINGNTYDVAVDLQNFTISQYIDFQMLWPKLKEDDTAYAQLLSTFIIPEGKKYNSKDEKYAYSLQDVIEEIDNSMPITLANSVLYFFLISLARSIRATEICYNLLMKILQRRAKTREEKEKIKTLEKETLKMINQAQDILGSL